MYRIFVFVFFSFFVSLFIFSSYQRASAQVLPDFSLPDIVGEPGTGIAINLEFENNGQIGGFDITVSMDTNVVEPMFVPVIPGPDLDCLPGCILGFSFMGGDINITLDQGPGSVPALPDGDLATLELLIDDMAQFGDQSALMITVNELTDLNGQAILPPDANVSDGSVTVGQDPGFIEISITKSADTSRIDPGIPAIITYTIRLEATGDPGVMADGTFVTDPLPDGAVFLPDMSTQPNCFQLIGPPNSIGCDVDVFEVGEVLDLEIAFSIVGQDGVDILNQAILNYFDELGFPVEKDSNTITIRVRSGGGGGGGCAISQTSPFDESGLINLSVLLIPLAFVLFRARRRVNK